MRKWTSSVHWIEHATSIHVHVASYCHDQCYTVITGGNQNAEGKGQIEKYRHDRWRSWTVMDPARGRFTSGNLVEGRWINAIGDPFSECFRLALVKRKLIIREIKKIKKKIKKSFTDGIRLCLWTELSSIRYVRIYRCRSYHGYRIGPADCTTRAF